MECNYLQNCLYFTVNRLSRVIGKMAEESFQRCGFSPTHAYLMMVVNEKGKVTPTELSQVLHMTPSTITRFVDKLVSKRLLVRETEGKNNFILPTEKGRESQAEIEKALHDLYCRYSEILGVDEAKSLTKIIHETCEKLENL